MLYLSFSWFTLKLLVSHCILNEVPTLATPVDSITHYSYRGVPREGFWLGQGKTNKHGRGESKISNFEQTDFLNGQEYSLLFLLTPFLINKLGSLHE